MRKFFWPSLMSLAMLWTFAPAASADTLTLTDTFGGSNTIWTLDYQSGCTSNCTVQLSVNFQDPDGAGSGTNAYTGDYIDAVQWVITGGDPTSVSLTSTTAGSLSDWGTALMDTSLSGGNQCNGGQTNSVCDPTVSAIGVGPIVNGSTWTWDFTVDFASAFTLTTGNIRASFNDSTGKNVNTFSPDFGNFTTTTTTGGTTTTGEQTTTTNGTVPEPGLLLLFGSGLTAAATRLRRRQRRSSESA